MKRVIKTRIFYVASFFILFQLTGCPSPDPTCDCSAECTESCTSKLLRNENIQMPGALRSYDVYLPSIHDYTESLPVIIDLHGYLSTSADEREISDFTDLADENGIIMVWPQSLTGDNCLGGTGPIPASGNKWTIGWDKTSRDVAFIDALIDKIGVDYHADLNRIYVTGLSDGGFMVYSLACALSNKIAAVASVAGSMTGDLMTNCNPGRALPVLNIHGTADQLISWDGDPSCGSGYSSVMSTVDFWKSQSGCNDNFDELNFDDIDTSDNSTVSLLTYQGCAANEVVELLKVTGGGHNWPGSLSMINDHISITLPINNDIDASEIIWNFFKDKTLQ